MSQLGGTHETHYGSDDQYARYRSVGRREANRPWGGRAMSPRFRASPGTCILRGLRAVPHERVPLGSSMRQHWAAGIAVKAGLYSPLLSATHVAITSSTAAAS